MIHLSMDGRKCEVDTFNDGETVFYLYFLYDQVRNRKRSFFGCYESCQYLCSNVQFSSCHVGVGDLQ